MSRGPGALQRDILEVLNNRPHERMAWSELKRRFPAEVRDKRFYRAVRSLKRMHRVLETADGGVHRLQATRPIRARSGVTYLCAEGVAELLSCLPREQRAALLPTVAEECVGRREPVVAYRPN